MDYNNNKNKKSENKFNLMDIGKIPPQAIDLEEAVIGAMLVENDAVITVMEYLKPESFYKDAYRKIYEAILELNKKKKIIDILTVKQQLKTNGTLDEIGGPLIISDLASKIGSAAHIEFHARIIQQKFIQREVIRISSEMQMLAFDESSDVDDILDYSEQQIFNLNQMALQKEPMDLKQGIKDAVKQIQKASQNKNSLSGVPSGFTKLDNKLGGWQKTDFIIIAARPSIGKTAIALNMAKNASLMFDIPVAVFSLEMSYIQLTNRLLSDESNIENDKLKNGKLEQYEWTQLESGIAKLENIPLYIDDTPALSVSELRSKARKFVLEKNVQLIIIDYLQLMRGGTDTTNKNGNREQEISYISRSLKSLAKELDIPVIALSQLSREVEKTADKKPLLSNLRESGSLEQDSDLVVFLYRGEKYGILEDKDGNSLVGKAEIIVAKNRNGATGSVMLKFEDRFTRFTDIDNNYNEFIPTESNFDSESENNKNRYFTDF